MYRTKSRGSFSQDYRLYIEGVQVPFESVSVTSVYREAPTATITMPPWPGLSELGRNYNPKVHVFWRDFNTSPSVPQNASLDEIRDSYKLIYSGIVLGTSESKSISPEGANQTLTLTCSHPIYVMREILIRYANQIVSAAQAQLAANSDGSVTVGAWDINVMMVKALHGVQEDAKEDTEYYVPKGKFNDLKGTPGALRVMWNLLKQDAIVNSGEGEKTVLKDIYIPLVEDGLKFWERMTGHPSIESGLDAPEGRVQYNTNVDTDSTNGVETEVPEDIMIPPIFKSFLGDAAQKEMTLAALRSLQAGSGSPESNSFYDTMIHFLDRLEYEMLILNSPVSKPDYSITEYIVKPRMTYYYAPICNVILPNLLDSVQVSNGYDRIPSRVSNISNVVNSVTGEESRAISQVYISPHSVRYARAGGKSGDLKASLSSTANIPGRYEYGSGVKAITTQLPSMYNLMKTYLDQADVDSDGSLTNSLETGAYKKVSDYWKVSYPEALWPGSEKYNPLGPGEFTGVLSFSRLNFMYSDQKFSSNTAKARTAQASGVFNPYPVVGYPMDVVDPSPSRESYHGLCTSITHVIHASGQASTSYSISAVTTFTELASFKSPSVNPYMSSVFDLVEDSRIYLNDTAYRKACEIYMEVLGVGAAEPALLQNYDTGTVVPFTRPDKSSYWVTGNSDMLNSVAGSYLLVARDITSLHELEQDRIKSNLSPFIDMSSWSDVNSTTVKPIVNTTTVKLSSDRTKIETPGRDTESSPFLDY